MKIWVLNNTKFDKYKEWENYFENDFIPNLMKYSKPDDIILHLGNIFNNSEIINMKLINKVIDTFNKIQVSLYFLDGHDTEFLNLIKNINHDFIIIDKPLKISSIKIIPRKFNIIENLEPSDELVFINSKIDKEILKNYNDKDFYCGGTDNLKISDNVVEPGSPYQFSSSKSNGIFIIDKASKKKKYLKNNVSKEIETLKITSLEEIDNLDKEYINSNIISIEIDKELINEKKIKLDVLLNDFNFKSVSYINDVEEIELVDSSSLKMEDLIIEQIKNSDNKKLLSEFDSILKIYKERY